MEHQIDLKFYPGWTRKAITFSIDDGNLEMDAKFKAIVEPYGLRGTFNLCSERLARMTPDEYRAFYRGHEIANHCKYHPKAFADGEEYVISDEPFNPETSDRDMVYRFGDVEGVYYKARPNGTWLRIATTEAYKRCIDEGHRELEEVFGKGSVRSFIWPYGQQKNSDLTEYVASIPYYYGDRINSPKGATPEQYFAPPNSEIFYIGARHNDLLERAKEYETLADDGELKFFCFGIHSVDYDRADKWGELTEFAKTYGNRPGDYYYAPIGDIYDYSEAVGRVEITEGEVKNPTNIDLHIKIDGEKYLLKAGESIPLG